MNRHFGTPRSTDAQVSPRDAAEALDRTDPLAAFRARFTEDAARRLYMDGNSLGRQPITVAATVEEAMTAWREDLILAWRDWIRVPTRLGDRLAEGVLEARPGEVVFGDSTTVNLYKAVSAALDARPGRGTMITSDDNFPTDLYVLQALAAQRGLTLTVVPADPVEGIEITRLADAVNTDTAVLALSHVAYRSGALLDMATLTRLAHDAGAFVLWDVSHSVGSVRVPLESSGADLAVGCSYKYLNGGPGAPSFVYVRRSLQGRLRQPIWGWFGHKEQFRMADAFVPADGIESFLAGAPAILSTLTIEAGIALLAEAGIDRLQTKGQGLTDLVVQLADAWLLPYGFTVVSPRDPERRGSHVTLRHSKAKEVVRALIAAGVIPDYRPPDMIRLGPAPLYTRYVDVWDSMDRLRQVCEQQPALRAD